MPETAVDQADSTVTRENEVRRARKSSVMQAVPETVRMQSATQYNLRACVFAADARHHARPGRLVHYVRHNL